VKIDAAQLNAWIVASQRAQKRVVIVAIAVLLVGIVLKFIGAVPALISNVVIAFALILGVCGFWVTAAHISDWRMRLAQLKVRS
jgi:uncharacterized membrane protein